MDAPETAEYQPPRSLRILQAMVTLLMVVMMAGIIAIASLLWLRYSKAQAPLPELITLPDGTQATAYTQGSDWYAVVTNDDQILIFDRATGRLRQTILIE
ncbi:hypothetical protein GGQ68_000877 [Sagittula marina]|uniref:Uncharacterized protein n=1 Tax=Sagittula marina TaxID=943940 RepID=A0A7W6DJT5_9RHOB|nr:DUF6476 family protein [Sagittula marina]MBB3984561.1 hypothetical protein [Sagittula marina]